jgi:hypothetical protein
MEKMIPYRCDFVFYWLGIKLAPFRTLELASSISVDDLMKVSNIFYYRIDIRLFRDVGNEK